MQKANKLDGIPVVPEFQRLWPSFAVLGMRVDVVGLPDVLSVMQAWITERGPARCLVAANSHLVMECNRDPALRQAVNKADLVLPDGIPLVLVGRRRGMPMKGRVPGPDLLHAALDHSKLRGCRHFFYGGTRDTLDALLASAIERWPHAQIVGTHAPPFRQLTAAEDQEIVAIINDAAPDVLWVSLGCPKQERWMHEHRDRLKVPVVAAVGQAVGIAAGVKRDVPDWIGKHGLEWLFRVVLEPRRTWSRVFLLGPAFAVYVALEELGLRRYEGGR